jgi:hypothetical protein
VAIVDALLPEFDHEMGVTRRVLERVPEDRFAWKPHPKSMSLVELSTHVATIPSWGVPTLSQPELDLGGQNLNTPAPRGPICSPASTRTLPTRVRH